MTVARRIKRGWAVGLPLVAVGLVVGAPRPGRADTGDAGAEALQREIAVRDAVIADLMDRVEALEEEALAADLRRRAGAFASAVAATVEPPASPARDAAPGPMAGPPPALLAALTASGDDIRPGPMPASAAVMAATVGGAAGVTPGAERGPAPAPERATAVAWTTEPVPDPRGEAPAPGRSRTESGAPEEEADDALRALERTLVEQGGLLLPEGAFEVSSATSYTYDSSGGLRFVDGVGIVDRNISRDTLENSVTLRLGLPWDSQAEVRVPYVVSREQVSTTGLAERDSDGSGLGDVEVGLTTQLVRESDVLPDLLGSVRWKATTGESAFEAGADDLAVGSGFHAVSGQLTAVKSFEPLVFFGSVSHTMNLPDSRAGLDIDPGDTTAFSLGTILAAGPGTSLRFGFEQSFSRNTEVDGRAIPGSDGVGAMIELGASAVLPFTESRSLLSVTAGAGLTEDAPDLRLEVSLPYRF